MSYDFSFDKRSGLLTICCVVVAGLLLFFAGFLLGIGKSERADHAEHSVTGLAAEQHSKPSATAVPAKSSALVLPLVAASDGKPSSRSKIAGAGTPNAGQESTTNQSQVESESLQTQHSNEDDHKNHLYCLQFGAFQDQKNAEKQVTFLKEKGISATVYPLESKAGKTWYAVRSGKYDSIEAAAKSASELSLNTKVSGLVRRIGAI